MAGKRIRQRRYVALDQVRGLMILAMIFAHFGPAAYERVGLDGTLLDLLNLFGRLATPGFLAVFGLTVGVVYLPRAIDCPAAMRNRLIKRSGVVLIYTIVVALPATARLLWSSDTAAMPHGLAYHLILGHYSVLMFYVVAIFLSGLAIASLSRAPFHAPFVLGAVLILVGTLLGHDLWTFSPGTVAELWRLLLVSGKYGVLVLTGLAWFLVPVGYRLVGEGYDSPAARCMLLTLSLSAVAVSLAMGRLVGWRSLSDLATGYTAPPQVWYLAMVGGFTCGLMLLLDLVWVRGVSRLLQLVGMVPLQVYVGHVFVQPMVDAMRTYTPQVPEAVCLALPLVVFGVYVAGWLYVAERKRREHGQTSETMVERSVGLENEHDINRVDAAESTGR